ncbi:hypothetical protein ACH4VS_27990 [Streptomyces hygroscopicus]|uniref:hypothetical protein n=1 Tax=Streptomyces hygroscopicus TaxID=1912 RepID=UPI000A41D789|nr:hypothetical protein [Streptomyces hygroscopicus]GLV77090.1 hypothetical protein Shyhy02_50900 [Streptomyces hygroscopicus subsp. hygroscopicus]
MTAIEQEWVRNYALLALRLNRQVTAGAGGTVLIYQGPQEWSRQAATEAPRPAGQLVEDADQLLEELPFESSRSRYLATQVRAMRAVARQQNGEELPLPDYARECLGVEVDWVPEPLFEQAHARLDAALPAGGGSLADRLNAWQAAHTLPTERVEQRLPTIVAKAVAETRARTSATIIPLPPDETVDCKLVAGTHFWGAGAYEGGLKSTIHINTDIPFNLADLLYLVAHEGHPGHIAEAMLKESHLVDRQGRLDQQVRFMLSPSFALGEGLGLHAESILFPDDQAQAWLTDNVLTGEDIPPDGSDFATVHDVKNVLWGVWGNAALLAAAGRPDSELAAYLTRWALYDEAEVAAALNSVRAPGMGVYVLGYYHGWRILRSWLDAPDRHQRVRRLLTEQLLPADLEAETA